jgi:hypothetical protein
MNKKAYSLSGWTEGILLSVLIVMILGIVIQNMNGMYTENHQIGLGTNTTKDAMVNYQGTLQSQIKGGEVEFSADQGLTLKSSWGILSSGINIVWDFLTGGWIETIVLYMKLPVEVALIFRILYFLSIGFIVLWILFKVKT